MCSSLLLFCAPSHYFYSVLYLVTSLSLPASLRFLCPSPCLSFCVLKAVTGSRCTLSPTRVIRVQARQSSMAQNNAKDGVGELFPFSLIRAPVNQEKSTVPKKKKCKPPLIALLLERLHWGGGFSPKQIDQLLVHSVLPKGI